MRPKATTIVLSLLLGVAVMAGPSSAGAQAPDMSLEAKIANAKSASDHREIAAAYEKLAAAARQRAAEHEKMGAAYKKVGGALVGKYHMDEHCAMLAKDAQSEAKQYEELAKAHEEMANSLN